MIDKVSYEDIISYSKELQASADAIQSLIDNKEMPELMNFIKEVSNYSSYLSSTVEMYKQADEALDYLREQNRTSS